MKPSTVAVKSVTGKVNRIVGELKVSLEVGDYIRTLSFKAIRDIDHDLILGMDFFESFDVELRPGKGLWRAREGGWMSLTSKNKDQNNVVYAECSGISELKDEERATVEKLVEHILHSAQFAPGSDGASHSSDRPDADQGEMAENVTEDVECGQGRREEERVEKGERRRTRERLREKENSQPADRREEVGQRKASHPTPGGSETSQGDSERVKRALLTPRGDKLVERGMRSTSVVEVKEEGAGQAVEPSPEIPTPPEGGDFAGAERSAKKKHIGSQREGSSPPDNLETHVQGNGALSTEMEEEVVTSREAEKIEEEEMKEDETTEGRESETCTSFGVKPTAQTGHNET